MKRLAWVLLALALALVGAAAFTWLLHLSESEVAVAPPVPAAPASGDLATRGAYLARVGNCMHCHTERGGPEWAGGRAIETPFGAVYASNLTPSPRTGIGAWTPDDFWRALHHGRSRDARALYPVFPYPNYTLVTRGDADALFAYLRTVKPVERENTTHDLRWPFSTQAALALWRALYFRPGAIAVDTAQTPQYARGAYLVQGLGHCSACHSARNALGGSNLMDLSGGMIPMQSW